MNWTQQEMDILADLWSRGYSASDIAACLPGKTRNAIIGKAHRMHLQSRPSPIKRPTQQDNRTHHPDRCQFIPGDPCGAETVYCGQPKAEHSRNYCAEHHARCYRKVEPTRGAFVLFERNGRKAA